MKHDFALDALVAEKVVGWLHTFSADMNCAWEVVEAMQREGWACRLAYAGDGNAACCFYRCVGAPELLTGPLVDGAWDRADTPAVAICRAALVAVGARPAHVRN